MAKQVKINLSEPGMKIEFISGGGRFPELNFIVDDKGSRKIGTITTIEELKKLKDALKDV